MPEPPPRWAWDSVPEHYPAPAVVRHLNRRLALLAAVLAARDAEIGELRARLDTLEQEVHGATA